MVGGLLRSISRKVVFLGKWSPIVPPGTSGQYGGPSTPKMTFQWVWGHLTSIFEIYAHKLCLKNGRRTSKIILLKNRFLGKCSPIVLWAPPPLHNSKQPVKRMFSIFEKKHFSKTIENSICNLFCFYIDPKKAIFFFFLKRNIASILVLILTFCRPICRSKTEWAVTFFLRQLKKI